MKKRMGSTNPILEEVVVSAKPQMRVRGWPRPRICKHQDVVQTETLPQISKSTCSTSPLFSSTITGKNTLKKLNNVSQKVELNRKVANQNAPEGKPFIFLSFVVASDKDY